VQAVDISASAQGLALGLGTPVCPGPKDLLIVHGLLAAWRAAMGHMQMPGMSGGDQSMARSKGLLAVVMASFFNPVAWLDTLLLVIGSVGATLPPATQTSFALGATAASFTWFTLRVAAARWAGPRMTKPLSWRVLEAGVATLMVGLALYLALDLV
jgi:L-lysine exporter family protein LysE/ArgO